MNTTEAYVEQPKPIRKRVCLPCAVKVTQKDDGLEIDKEADSDDTLFHA